MATLFYTCLWAVLYTYCGYPLLLIAAIPFFKKTNSAAATEPRAVRVGENRISSVDVIITVHNEAPVLQKKLQVTIAAAQHLAETRGIKANIVVASDASTDGSDDVARTHEKDNVHLVSLPERGGKEVAQGEAFSRTSGDIVIFTDAKITHGSELFARFLPYFADPRVGVVSSCDEVLGAMAGGSGEKMYVRYEMWLRSLEDQCEGLIGASGSCFAVRRSAVTGWFKDVPSDFVIPLSTSRRGFVTRHAPDVVCAYQSVPSEEHEFRRKVRTVLRGISALWLFQDRMDPGTNGFRAIQLVSHKLMRWLFPVFALGMVASSLWIAAYDGLAQLVLLGSLLAGGAALFAYLKPEFRSKLIFKVPLYLLVSNSSILVAWYKFLGGARAVHWSPSGRPQ